MQLRALKRWEFTRLEENGEWWFYDDDLEIQWNMEQQFGAYTLDRELYLIHNWDELDSIMQQTSIY